MLRQISIENLRIQVKMLEKMIAEEEKLLARDEQDQPQCGCNGRSDSMITDN